MGHILALGVGDHGANLVLRGCRAFGVRGLLASLHRQALALLPRHLLAHLVAGALLDWNMFAHLLGLVMRFLVGMVDRFLVGMVVRFVDGDRLILFVQNMLLGAETNSKASAKSEFLANVPTNHCTSEMGGSQSAETNSSEGTFLPNGAVCCNSFAFVAFFTFGHFSVFLTNIFLTNVFKLIVHVFNLRDFVINGPLPLLVMLLGLVVMPLDLVALFLLLHPALGLVPTLLGTPA